MFARGTKCLEYIYFLAYYFFLDNVDIPYQLDCACQKVENDHCSLQSLLCL